MKNTDKLFDSVNQFFEESDPELINSTFELIDNMQIDGPTISEYVDILQKSYDYHKLIFEINSSSIHSDENWVYSEPSNMALDNFSTSPLKPQVIIDSPGHMTGDSPSFPLAA